MQKIEPHVKNEFLIGLGKITGNFAYLEAVVSFFVWELVDDQQIGQIVTSQLSFDRLLNVLGALYRYRSKCEGKIDELMELLKEASEAEQNRNKITHSVWGFNEEGFSRMKFSVNRKKGARLQYEDIFAEDLNRIADEISEVANRIKKFMSSHKT